MKLPVVDDNGMTYSELSVLQSCNRSQGMVMVHAWLGDIRNRKHPTDVIGRQSKDSRGARPRIPDPKHASLAVQTAHTQQTA